MKTLKLTYIGIASLLLTTSACRNLDEYNPSGATADATWSTPEGFITNVNAAYDQQRSWYSKEDGIFMGETGTDLWYNREKNTYAAQLTQYAGLTPLQGNPVRSTWTALWKAINQCNAGIGRIGNAGFVNMVDKNRREGELRFLRAFYYWHIVETWGGVMLRTTETQQPELTAVRSAVPEFYNLIISDLEFAAQNLPLQSVWGNEYSRASKKSALGFLARAYLSRAYYSLSAGNQAEARDFFTKARDTAKDIIARKGELEVDLWANPTQLWDPANNKRNKEAMYIISISTNPSLNIDANPNRVFMTFQTPYTGGLKPGLEYSLSYGYDNERRLMPTRTLLDYFDETKDARYAASFQEAWVANTAANYTWTSAAVTAQGKDASVVGKVITSGRDTALYITKKSIPNKRLLPYVVIDRDSIYSANGTIRGGTRDFVTLKKFMDPFRTAPAVRVGTRDVLVMRFAEMYMIAAEADVQLGDVTDAAAMVNVLRTRAAVAGKVADMQVTPAQMTLDFILEERAREFCGEYIRWFDIKRIKYGNNGQDFADFIAARNPDITQVKNFHRLRPIRQEELNALLNADEFGQNPGY